MRRFVIVSSFMLSVLTAPAPLNDNDFTVANSFMTRFGYLPKEAAHSESLVRMEDAIMEVQRFGGIPQTGYLDHRTLELMKSPRCGVPDKIHSESKLNSSRTKRFVLSPTLGWKKRLLSYYVSNWSPQIDRYDARAELQKALTAWGKYSKLDFQETTSSSADIVVAFRSGNHGDGYPFDGPGSTLAHAFSPGDDIGGDIHFDAEEIWKINPGQLEDGEDFFSVAVHEIGHSLGLYHSPDQRSVMFPYYRRHYSSSFTLDYDDILGLYELYKNNFEQDSNSDGGSKRYPTTKNPHVTQRRRPQHTHPHTRGHSTSPSITTESSATHVPNICQGHFNSVAFLRGELFVFKDQYVWRMYRPGYVVPGYPVPIYRMFHELQHNVVKVDAAYERVSDYNLVFFSDNVYWVYNGDYFVSGPRPLSDYGLPSYVKKVDAVMVWGRNKKTFIFSGYEYWKFDEYTRRMDPGYPKSIELFRGVPHDLDSAMTWSDGITYFFKDSQYWAFNNTYLRTEPNYPREASPFWLGCQKRIWGGRVAPKNLDTQNNSNSPSGSSGSENLNSSSWSCLCIVLLVLVLQNLKILVFHRIRL